MTYCNICEEEIKEGQSQMSRYDHGRVHWKCWEHAD